MIAFADWREWIKTTANTHLKQTQCGGTRRRRRGTSIAWGCVGLCVCVHITSVYILDRYMKICRSCMCLYTYACVQPPPTPPPQKKHNSTPTHTHIGTHTTQYPTHIGAAPDAGGDGRAVLQPVEHERRHEVLHRLCQRASMR